ncbi:MAG: Hsp20/alpha crystallin family protein [Acidimicrobiales bacterium]|nr:Hsp20/alpha crystallin family protein [Acidimicrobiales bacterium]MBO0893579.1 Hsp20/alpha crystallin family protein [Acidimicrobiales bacterium]
MSMLLSEPFSDPLGIFGDLGRRLWSSSSGQFGAIDAYQDKEAAVVAVDLPGVDPSELELTAEASTLTIQVRRHWSPPEGVQMLASERPEGSLTRRLSLSDNLDLNQVDARYDRGVLYVRIPLVAEARPHRIEVGTGRAGAIDVESQSAARSS